MAEITMNISEYELLKENKKLLEDSLQKERGLQQQIEVLNKEKLKILEDSKMKIIYTTIQQTEEFLLEIDEKEIRKMFDYRGSYISSSDQITYMLQYLKNNCLKKRVAYQEPVKSIIFLGLDEVKAEIQKDLDTKYKSKMDALTKQIKLESDNNKIIEAKNLEIKILQKSCNDLHKDVALLQGITTLTIDKIINCLSNISIWNFKLKVKEINDIIR